jgi:ubiquinone biosynthesis protein
MVMIDGFFHADPHPGNVVVGLTDGRLTFLDTGMVGELDLSRRITLGRFVLAFRDGDVAALAATLRSLSEPFRDPDPTSYQRQFVQRIGPLVDTPPGQPVRLQKLVAEALEVLRSTGYRLDSQLALALKAVAQAEAITSALVPGGDASYFAELGGAALEELVPEAVSMDSLRKAARKEAVLAVGEVAERLPSLREGAFAWLDQIQAGQLNVKVHVADVDRHLTRLEPVPRLIALSIVITGLLVGSALAAGIDTGKSTFRTDVVDAALVVYIAVMALAVVLVAALGWRLVRPAGRADRRQSGSRSG